VDEEEEEEKDETDSRKAPPSSRKKKKRRSSSKVNLIREEDDGDGSSLSSARSHRSLHSEEEEERYRHIRNERILRNFQSPSANATGRESKSRPIPLSEESAYENMRETRIDSVASRPRSPSPKQSQRISFANQQSDYVMRVSDKHSTSSLSTIALQDHDDSGKLVSTDKPALSPHREESFDSKQSSKTSVLSIRRVEVLSKSQEAIDEVDGGESAVSPTLSLSGQSASARKPRGFDRSPRASEVSQISLSNGRVQSPIRRRMSANSELTNITLASEKLPSVSASETELTAPVPDEKPTNPTDNVTLKDDMSESATLVFEDEFVHNDNDQNIDFLQQSIMVAEERQRSSSKSSSNTPSEKKKPLDAGLISDADSQKIAPYIKAFKRRRNSDQFSFGSESGESERGVPLATLNEDSDSYALSDTLKRVKKLSDAFPTALEQEKLKKRSLPHPRFNKQSMSELSVVEYNRKKKFKRKRPGSSSSSANKQQLPPLVGRKPLPGVTEENDDTRSDSDI